MEIKFNRTSQSNDKQKFLDGIMRKPDDTRPDKFTFSLKAQINPSKQANNEVEYSNNVLMFMYTVGETWTIDNYYIEDYSVRQRMLEAIQQYMQISSYEMTHNIDGDYFARSIDDNFDYNHIKTNDKPYIESFKANAKNFDDFAHDTKTDILLAQYDADNDMLNFVKITKDDYDKVTDYAQRMHNEHEKDLKKLINKIRKLDPNNRRLILKQLIK